MNAESEALFEAALQLPPAERREFIGRLIETVPIDEVTLALDDPGLPEELDRRFADDGKTVSWSDLYEEG